MEVAERVLGSVLKCAGSSRATRLHWSLISLQRRSRQALLLRPVFVPRGEATVCGATAPSKQKNLVGHRRLLIKSRLLLPASLITLSLCGWLVDAAGITAFGRPSASFLLVKKWIDLRV